MGLLLNKKRKEKEGSYVSLIWNICYIKNDSWQEERKKKKQFILVTAFDSRNLKYNKVNNISISILQILGM